MRVAAFAVALAAACNAARPLGSPAAANLCISPCSVHPALTRLPSLHPHPPPSSHSLTSPRCWASCAATCPPSWHGPTRGRAPRWAACRCAATTAGWRCGAAARRLLASMLPHDWHAGNLLPQQHLRCHSRIRRCRALEQGVAVPHRCPTPCRWRLLPSSLTYHHYRCPIPLALQEVKLSSIAGTVIANSSLNLVGMGATIIALQVRAGWCRLGSACRADSSGSAGHSASVFACCHSARWGRVQWVA